MYKTLVLSGGGIKGFGLLGILHRFSEQYCFSDIVSFVGSSVGGVIVALLSFNFSPIEVMFFFMDLLPISYRSDRDRVLEKLRCIVQDTTFQQLYETKGKNLILTSFDKKNKESIFYSKSTHPSKKIIEAISETSNIPFINNPEDILIDGCLVTPFPVRYAKINCEGPLLGVYTLTKNTTLLPVPNLYDDFKIVFQQVLNTITIYETYFADTSDTICQFENDLPFEVFQVDWLLTKELFIHGYRQFTAQSKILDEHKRLIIIELLQFICTTINS